MNAAYVHLLLNHFPIIGSLLGAGVLLWGTFKQSVAVQKTGSAILFLMALVAIPVYLTGEPAEEAVEKLPGISKALIEQHEEAATLALVMMALAGLSAAVNLLVPGRKPGTAKALFNVTALLALLSFAAMARTGYYGGKIRHTEISGSVTAPATVPAPASQQEKDDDD